MFKSYFVYQRSTGSWAIAEYNQSGQSSKKALPWRVLSAAYETRKEASQAITEARRA